MKSYTKLSMHLTVFIAGNDMPRATVSKLLEIIMIVGNAGSRKLKMELATYDSGCHGAIPKGYWIM